MKYGYLLIKKDVINKQIIGFGKFYLLLSRSDINELVNNLNATNPNKYFTWEYEKIFIEK